MLHRIEEAGLEVLEALIKEIEVNLSNDLVLTVRSTPLFQCADLKYKYVNRLAPDTPVYGVVYWPNGFKSWPNEPFRHEGQNNVYPFDQDAVNMVLDFDVMLLLIKQMLS